MADGDKVPVLADLLQDFDAAEADYQGIAKSSGVVGEIEAAVGKFLDTVWPKIQPFVNAGIDFLAIAAGAAAGPLGPLVEYVADAFGKVGLNYLVRWLAQKLSSAAPKTA